MSQVVIVPHPALRRPAKPITTLDRKSLSLISDLITTLKATKNPQGVGLAAPQIGQPYRIFLIRPHPWQEPKIFINPEILSSSQRLQSPKKENGTYEGCLSIPGHYAPLSRSMSVTVKYQSPVLSTQPGPGESKLIEKIETFSGFPAHIIQHELDHLNGILFIDRVLEQNSKLFRVTGKTWEEVSL